MVCRRFSVAVYCAWVAVGAPTLNVITEGPAAPADETEQNLRAATAEAATFAASVREATGRMSAETQRVLDAHSVALSSSSIPSPNPVAGFFSTRDAHAELERLSSIFHAEPRNIDGVRAIYPPPQQVDKTAAAESSVREMLVDAGKKFADAAGEQFIPSSFLQPVDANFLRKGLRATEPMRSPPPMTVNVITVEDVPALRQKAIYKGLAAQTIALQNAFQADAAALDAPPSSDIAPLSFAGVDALAGAEVITLRPPLETTADIERAVAALKDTRSSKRIASTKAYNADWQRMLDAEKSAIGSLVRSELRLSKDAARTL